MAGTKTAAEARLPARPWTFRMAHDTDYSVMPARHVVTRYVNDASGSEIATIRAVDEQAQIALGLAIVALPEMLAALTDAEAILASYRTTSVGAHEACIAKVRAAIRLAETGERP